MVKGVVLHYGVSVQAKFICDWRWCSLVFKPDGALLQVRVTDLVECRDVCSA